MHSVSGRVQVYGPPEESLLQDERACTGRDRGEIVVFHVPARPCGGGWFCPSCGFATLEGAPRPDSRPN